jgi:hypothetical protein
MNLKKIIRYYAGYARPTVERIGLQHGRPCGPELQPWKGFHLVAGRLLASGGRCGAIAGLNS